MLARPEPPAGWGGRCNEVHHLHFLQRVHRVTYFPSGQGQQPLCFPDCFSWSNYIGQAMWPFVLSIGLWVWKAEVPWFHTWRLVWGFTSSISCLFWTIKGTVVMVCVVGAAGRGTSTYPVLNTLKSSAEFWLAHEWPETTQTWGEKHYLRHILQCSGRTWIGRVSSSESGKT